MIVVDASAMVEALIGRDVDAQIFDALAGDVAAPHLLDVEVVSVLRGLERGRKVSCDVAEQAIRDHFAFAIARHEAEPLAGRVWELRHQLTAYDASYVALAEALGAPLYTCDTELVAGGHDVDVKVVSRTH